MYGDNIFLILFFNFIILSLVVLSASRMNREGGLLLELKKHEFALHAGSCCNILQSCFSLVPSPEQLILSQPDLISKTDCDLAGGGEEKEPS